MNGTFKEIEINTTQPSKIIINRDTVRTVGNRTIISVPRGNNDLNITAQTEKTSKTVTVNPGNSAQYYSNILFNYGIGMLVDADNPKRYSYPSVIYLNSEDTLNEYYIYPQASPKGKFAFHFSLPHINSFYLKPDNESIKSNTGFWGLSLGLDYYHTDNQFLNISISGATDFFLPIPAPVDLYGKHELMNSVYVSTSNNHFMNWFTVGYGLAVGRDNWSLRDYGSQPDSSATPLPIKDPINKTNFSMGTIFTIYYRHSEVFNIGLVYRPTFVRFSSAQVFRYEHLISIDFAWKIGL